MYAAVYVNEKYLLFSYSCCCSVFRMKETVSQSAWAHAFLHIWASLIQFFNVRNAVEESFVMETVESTGFWRAKRWIVEAVRSCKTVVWVEQRKVLKLNPLNILKFRFIIPCTLFASFTQFTWENTYDVFLNQSISFAIDGKHKLS